MAVLSPIWSSKPPTARRVRQRIGTVMKWAIAHSSNAGSDLSKKSRADKSFLHFSSSTIVIHSIAIRNQLVHSDGVFSA